MFFRCVQLHRLQPSCRLFDQTDCAKLLLGTGSNPRRKSSTPSVLSAKVETKTTICAVGKAEVLVIQSPEFGGNEIRHLIHKPSINKSNNATYYIGAKDQIVCPISFTAFPKNLRKHMTPF